MRSRDAEHKTEPLRGSEFREVLQAARPGPPLGRASLNPGPAAESAAFTAPRCLGPVLWVCGRPSQPPLHCHVLYPMKCYY